MAGTKIEEYVAEDLKKMEGVSYPVKAKLLERLFIRKAACENLHPNPEDEFSIPDIGPSHKIISEYEEKYRESAQRGLPASGEPLIVEKLHPLGYLLLNGHHRWAAAMNVGIKKLPIRIINVAQESDIRTILENSQHDKRVTMDLDEVVFCSGDDPYAEEPLHFPYSLRYKQRIRLGIPALFYALAREGYDIWVYTAEYYSIDDIRDLFRCYSVNVDGIITCTAKRKPSLSPSAARMKKLVENKYSKTLHIDNNMILVTHGHAGEYEEYELNAPEGEWAKTVVAKIREMEKDDEGI